MRALQHLPSLLLLLFLFQSCGPANEAHLGTPNGLIDESSPYLLQHAYNPVDWQPWKDQALTNAVDDDKMLLISIGYASCHWCHVMEKESFTDSTVAGLMNDNFVSIKVDREERPDVDQVYMDAALLMNGRGGWPLNIVALPDGRPVYAGTYLPKDNWIRVLEFFRDTYRDDKDKLLEQAQRVTEGVGTMELITLNSDEAVYDPITYSNFYEQTVLSLDLRRGGKRGAPKFPNPIVYEAMLLQAYHNGEQQALDAVTVTLDKISRGGIYDQLASGFARYSVDGIWKVPHFEKMLYDNALLISLYSHGFQITKSGHYQKIISETINFLNAELRHRNGGYYSSIDADSEGEEGKYYTWTADEIDQILGEDSEVFKNIFQVKPEGNWEDGQNILHLGVSDLNRVSRRYNISIADINDLVLRSKKKLLDARKQRIAPSVDDKILTSWNALTIKGLVQAYFALGKGSYLKDALRTAEFLEDNQLRKDGGLYRNFKDGKSTINAFLEDYAYTIDAFIDLYQATFDEKWLNHAKSLTAYVQEQFMNEETQMFYYTSNEDNALITRKVPLSDNIIPSANAVMAENLLKLGHYFYDEQLIGQAKQMLNNMLKTVEENPYYYSSWTMLYAKLTHPYYEIAIVGEDADERRDEMLRTYLPNGIVMGGEDEGTLELLTNKLVDDKTMIYVCENKTCRLPVTEVDRALTQILKAQPQSPASDD